MTRLRMGDTVIVTAGAQRGDTGRLLKIDKKHGTVLVEGINLKWKHERRSQEQPQGGRSLFTTRVSSVVVVLVKNSMLFRPIPPEPAKTLEFSILKAESL